MGLGGGGGGELRQCLGSEEHAGREVELEGHQLHQGVEKGSEACVQCSTGRPSVLSRRKDLQRKEVKQPRGHARVDEGTCTASQPVCLPGR